MADFSLQRKNMVESQVRPSDITDRRILRAMQDVPRERFVPPAARSTAYMDESVEACPAQAGRPARHLLAPRLLAKLIQQLEINDTDQVLEVGSGTGYATALLAKIAREVVGVESDASLADAARQLLLDLGVSNVAIVNGELRAGCSDRSPYDAILINGCLPELPSALLDQLKDGGRLTTVVSQAGLSRAMQWRRIGAAFDARVLFETGAPVLPGFERKPQFVF